jgi:hypothetical protein
MGTNKRGNCMKKIGFLFLVIILLVSLMNSCDSNSDPYSNPYLYPEPTYTVWVSTESYTDYYSIFGTLNDGYYRKIEIFSGEINYSALPNESKRIWNEKEIYNWLFGRGFIESEAKEVTAWITSTTHCIIASRSGSIVHILIK